MLMDYSTWRIYTGAGGGAGLGIRPRSAECKAIAILCVLSLALRDSERVEIIEKTEKLDCMLQAMGVSNVGVLRDGTVVLHVRSSDASYATITTPTLPRMVLVVSQETEV